MNAPSPDTRRRLPVFAINERGATSTWVRAGTAHVDPASGSMDIELEVLPVAGRLHVSAVEVSKRASAGATEQRLALALRHVMRRDHAHSPSLCDGCKLIDAALVLADEVPR